MKHQKTATPKRLKMRTAILTPLQVRDAILDWAEKSSFFRSPDEAAAALLTLREDGSASLKITAQP